MIGWPAGYEGPAFVSATSIGLTDGTVVGGSGDVTIASTKTHPKGRYIVNDCGAIRDVRG